MRKDYTKFPANASKIGLPCNAFAIYVVMCGVAESFNPSIRFLANTLRISCSTVVRNIAVLESRNLIRKIGRGDLKNPNVYAFQNPKEWR